MVGVTGQSHLNWVAKQDKWGASQNGGTLSQNLGNVYPRSVHDLIFPDQTVFLSPHSSPLSPRFGAVGPIRPSLVRGLRPRNAPSPTTCLAGLLASLGQVPNRESFAGPLHQTHQIPWLCPCPLPPQIWDASRNHQIPVGAGLVPAHAHRKSGTHPGFFESL